MSYQGDGERRESEWRQGELTWLDMQRFRPGLLWGPPDRVPRKQPGDGWIILGAFVGAAVGGVAGGAIGAALGSFIIGIIAGVLVCGLSGTLLGNHVKKSHARRGHRAQTQD